MTNDAQNVTELPRKRRLHLPTKAQLKKAANVTAYAVTAATVFTLVAKKGKDAGYEEAVNDVEELDSES